MNILFIFVLCFFHRLDNSTLNKIEVPLKIIKEPALEKNIKINKNKKYWNYIKYYEFYGNLYQV